MNSSELAIKMINYSQGNLHDINHFLKVYSYAQIIGKQEKLEEETQFILEVSALLHDIACPLCRVKYGNTEGKYQEKEGGILARNFLEKTNLSKSVCDRIVFLVAHHHTYSNVNGLDYQILLEADYLVNADESNYSKENILKASKQIFKTKTGLCLLKSIYNF